jgi:hypothetical protein
MVRRDEHPHARLAGGCTELAHVFDRIERRQRLAAIVEQLAAFGEEVVVGIDDQQGGAVGRIVQVSVHERSP